MTTVTALVLTNGRRKYFEQSFSSLISQTVIPDEIVIVDDSDEDYVSEVLSKYEDLPHIKHVRNEGHETVGDARVTGFNNASCDVILQLDDDDLIEPSLIERGVEKIENGHGVCTCHKEYIGSDGDHISEGGWRNCDRGWEVRLPDDSLRMLLMHYEFATPSGMFCRRDVAEKVGGPKGGVNLGEDWEFTVRLANESSVAVIDDFLVKYRIHSDQITNTDEEEWTSESLRGMLDMIQDQFGHLAMDRGINFYRRFRSRHLVWLGESYVEHGYPVRGRFYLFLASILYPERHWKGVLPLPEDG